MLTLDELKEAMPPQFKKAATVSLLDKVNDASENPIAAQSIRENFVSYSSVLKDGRFKIEDYLNACKYVSFKMMEYNNQEAYMRAFPDRWAALKAAAKSSKEISAYVANYNKNKLVNLILEQSIIPSWIMNQDVYQKAIDTQLELMMDETCSAKVRTEAANSILTHLKKPETKKVELDIGVKDNSGIEQLRQTMAELAENQMNLIRQGAKTKDIAHQRLVHIHEDEDMIDVTPSP